MRTCKDVVVALLLFMVAEQYVNATWNFQNIPHERGFDFGSQHARNFPGAVRIPRPRNFQPFLGGSDNSVPGRLPRHGIFPGWRWDTGNNKFPQQDNSVGGLREGFYNAACPNAESIVRNTVQAHFNKDPTIAAGILRMFFHDCFVRVSFVEIIH
jgi:hypothetical protein